MRTQGIELFPHHAASIANVVRAFEARREHPGAHPGRVDRAWIRAA